MRRALALCTLFAVAAAVPVVDPDEDEDDGESLPERLRGVEIPTPAKFDDTAVKEAVKKIPLAGVMSVHKVAEFAAKGFHMQLPRVTHKDGVLTPHDKKLWANKNPSRSAQRMKEKGKSEDEITQKVEADTQAYERGISWMKSMEVAIMDLKKKGVTKKKPLHAAAMAGISEKVKGLDNLVAAEMEAKRVETGKKQSAGQVFKSLDKNRDGKLSVEDDPAVKQLLEKFGLENQAGERSIYGPATVCLALCVCLARAINKNTGGPVAVCACLSPAVSFEMFKMGVRDAKMRLKKHIESLKGGPDYKGHKKKLPGKIDHSHKGGPVRSIRDPPKKLHGR
jgi:hypothetical protein